MRDPLNAAFRINGERLVIVGWTRAILLQLAHPLIAAGVYEHSGFRTSPLAAITRLQHTVRAMLALTFGDERRREAAINGIRQVHTRVNGQLLETVGRYPAGTPYSAEDPALLLWVHATVIESMVLTFEQLVGPVSREERNDYCVASAPPAIALGVRESEAPLTWGALETYLACTYDSGAIVIGPQALELADALLRTSLAGVLAPARWVSGLVTGGLLPERMRTAYHLAWDDTRQRYFDRLTATSRALRRLAPRPLVLWRDARNR